MKLDQCLLICPVTLNFDILSISMSLWSKQLRSAYHNLLKAFYCLNCLNCKGRSVNNNITVVTGLVPAFLQSRFRLHSVSNLLWQGKKSINHLCSVRLCMNEAGLHDTRGWKDCICLFCFFSQDSIRSSVRGCVAIEFSLKFIFSYLSEQVIKMASFSVGTQSCVLLQ